VVKIFTSMCRKLACTTLAAAISVTAFSGAVDYAHAQSVDVQEKLAQKTKEQVKQKFIEFLPLKRDEQITFATLPGVKAPYSFGRVQQKHLQDGLNTTNFVRYVAGLPDDIELDMTREETQQAAAVIQAVHGGLSHYPTKPANMSEAFYKLAYEGAKTSNISAGRSKLYENVVRGYMSDLGDNNLSAVGHRRWILNPQMKKTMFGAAYAPNSKYDWYSSMYAFNKDRSKDDVSYQYIAWPSPGAFPVEFPTI